MRQAVATFCGFAVLCLAVGEMFAAEGDWPAWRGPNSSGVAAATTFPPAWPDGPLTPLWTAALGDGWSSPVVVDGRVFAMDRSGMNERVVAFDAATGRQLWQQINPVDFEPHSVGRRHGNGPKSTPAATSKQVFTLGIAGRLQCLNVADGSVVWKRDLPADFSELRPLPGDRAVVNGDTDVTVPLGQGRGAAIPLFGYTGSPVVDGELVILPVGGPRGGTIMAFDQATGQVVWQTLNENVSYSSPIVANLAGVKQVVAMTGPSVVGLEVKTGRLLWSFDYQNQYDESIGTPVVGGDLVLVTAVGRPLSAHRIVPRDSRFDVVEVWQSDDLSSYLSSMLVVDEFVYGMNDGGEWHCLQLADGKTVWRGGNHGYHCTPILVDRRLLGLNERGELAVVAADATAYRPLALNRLSAEPTWSAPAVVGNRIFIRSRSTLACFEIR